MVAQSTRAPRPRREFAIITAIEDATVLSRFALLFAAILVVACDSTDPEVIAGTYTATTFLVTPTGQSPVNVLTSGGSLTMSIAADNAVTGTLIMPASVTGGAAVNASMAGTAVQTGSTVTFTQTADTFVRDLEWSVQGSTLSVVNQAAGGANFTVTLTRQ